MHKQDSAIAVPMVGKSGFVSSGGQGAIGMDSPVGEVLISLILGAFCGLVIGMIIANLYRYFSMMAGRHVGGYGLAIYGAILGAALFAFMSVTDKD
jgi:NhaP-type Na+/H+ or K+/H+ antiporter